MLASSIPYKFAQPFANDAGPTFITNPIPLTTSTPDAASLEQGFPAPTFSPGGAPRGADFNGILFAISAWAQWQQAGGPIVYDAAFQTAIGGYPSAAVVQSATTAHQFWQSTTDNNVTNPDSAGAGWTDISAATAQANAEAYALSLQPVEFASAQLALSGTSVTAAHGLGAAPKGGQWGAYLVCQTADSGFSAGDQVVYPATTYTGAGGGTGSYAWVAANATNVEAGWSSAAAISVYGPGGAQYITPSNWKIVLWARSK